MGDALVVTASAAHVEGILDALESVASEGRWIGTEVPFDRDLRRERIFANIERPDVLVLVAVADVVVVGELTLRPLWPGLLGLGMAVTAPWRSRGVGNALLGRGIEWARRSGAYKVSLEVFPHNASAIALYERHGFVREGLLRRHIRRKNGELFDCIPMGLPID